MVEINNPFVSVVIPALNTDQTVGLTLNSLLSQAYENREIIVVDGGSTDKTKDIVNKYPVKLIESEKKGISYQKNLGIKNSMGEIVAFTDADIVVDKNWLKYLVQNYSHDSVVACGGAVLPYVTPYVDYKPQTIIERFSSKEFVWPNYFLKTEKPMKLKRIKNDSRIKNDFISGCIIGGNSSYRKDFLNKVGGFDNNIKIGEDVDLSYRIHKMGLTIIWDPRAIVYHPPKRTISSLIVQYYKYGTCEAPVYKKHSSKKIFIDNRNYRKLYFNAVDFLKRLATVHYQEDKELYLFTPVMDSVIVSSLIAGSIMGSTKQGILTL